MERRDFIKKLGIALGATSLPIAAIASAVDNEFVNDDVLKSNMKVYYYSRAFCGGSRSRYYLRKEEAYIAYLLECGVDYTYFVPGEHRTFHKQTWDVLTLIQGAAWKTKFCLPEYGGKTPAMYYDINDSYILEDEVTFEEFLTHNSKPGRHDRVSGTTQNNDFKAKR